MTSQAISPQRQDALTASQIFPLFWTSIKRFQQKGHKTDAGALTFTSLFALVPLLTVTYSMLSMVPALQSSVGDLQSLLLQNLMPATGDNLMQYLNEFSQQARKLTVIGLVFLVITAFTMLRSIEVYFNKIWQLPDNRNGLQSFLLYWAVLSLGPVLLGAGLAVNSYVASLTMWQSDWVPSLGLKWLNLLLPYFASFIAFSLLYWAVPNCSVKVKHAFTGGAIVALCFEVAKRAFAEATTMFPSYQLIYGAFAAVPLFLLWVYVSWTLVLWGAECVHLMGSWRAYRSHKENNKALPQWRARCQVIEQLHQSQVAVKDEGSHSDLHKSVGMSLDQLHQYLPLAGTALEEAVEHLLQQQILLEKDHHYFLIRDYLTITLESLLADLSVQQWQELEGEFETNLERKVARSLCELQKAPQQSFAKTLQALGD